MAPLTEATAQRRLRAIMDNATSFVAILDREGRVIEVNRASCERVGHSPALLQGEPFWQAPGWAHDPAEQARIRDAILSALDGRAARQDYTLSLASGAKVVVDLAFTPLLDERGELEGVFAAGMDVTSPRKLQAVLQHLSTQLVRSAKEQLFDEITAYMAHALDVEIGFIIVRDPVDPEQLTTLALHVDGQLIPAQRYALPGTPCEQVIRQGAPIFYGSQVQDVFPDDQELVTLGVQAYAAAPMVQPDGQVQGHVGVMARRALTQREPLESILRLVSLRVAGELERRRLDTQAAHAQRLEALGTLAGGIAHDFNNLLTAITANAELARMAPEDALLVAQSLDEIGAAASRARDLVQRILAFSRREPPRKQLVDLRLILDEVAALMRASLPARITMRVTRQERPWLVWGDPTQLHQALVNLCTNAWQAITAPTGTIELTLACASSGPSELPDEQTSAQGCAGSWLTLRVRDDGCGMTPQTLARVFEPFFTTRPLGQGTGLGMSMTHGIITAHGGVIEATSSPQRGTTWTIRLPLAPQADVGQPRTAAPHLPKPDRSRPARRILLVDDDEALARVHRLLLERVGYQVTSVTRPTQALDQALDSYDLLITDLNMPELSGVELAQAACQRAPGLAVLLLSGDLTPAASQLAQERGWRTLRKPYSAHELAQATLQALAHTPDQSPDQSLDHRLDHRLDHTLDPPLDV